MGLTGGEGVGTPEGLPGAYGLATPKGLAAPGLDAPEVLTKAEGLPGP